MVIYMEKTNLIDLRRFKKLEKQYIVINFFLDNLDCTISDICEYFGNTISSSSVQRYLNDYDFFNFNISPSDNAKKFNKVFKTEEIIEE